MQLLFPNQEQHYYISARVTGRVDYSNAKNMLNYCYLGWRDGYFSILSLLDIFFIDISNFIPFSHFPPENPLSHPLFPCSLTHPPLLPCPGVTLHRDMEPLKGQVPFLSMMYHKVILCYKCGFLHVFTVIYKTYCSISMPYFLLHTDITRYSWERKFWLG